MWEDIPAAMAELDADDSVRVVVLAGRGPAFTVGIDIELLASMQPAGPSPAASNMELYQLIRRMQDTASCFSYSPKPVIAAVHGYCLGAGLDLITACDIRLAAENALFSIRETRMGLVADIGTLQRLPAIVGPGHTAELAFTGSDIDSAQALAIGLLNGVHPDPAATVEAAKELAAQIAENSPLVVRGIKRVLAANDGRTVDTGGLPGEPIDFGPAAGDVLAVIGVSHDDVLNLRSAPGAEPGDPRRDPSSTAS
jgi:enoyl-CoA hydratase